ncbi:MAG: TIGR03667 family PPOX class F420-dependent oxidoreductase [Chloroflexaceae bacterium]|nr:TIGR03667 family PPOX class F420-dependent oxidoreductase [Chloroflexaceae bacterium]
MFDSANPKHAHVLERLQRDQIIWLGTVRPNGRPHLVPVWFLWQGDSMLIFSQPDNQKIRNLRHSPHVTLALETGDDGDDVAIIEGTAELLPPGMVDVTLKAYVEKYAEGIQHIGMTPESMAATYSQGIRVTPSKLIAW